jgi:hypothetical protein
MNVCECLCLYSGEDLRDEQKRAWLTTRRCRPRLAGRSHAGSNPMVAPTPQGHAARALVKFDIEPLTNEAR